MSRNKKQQGCPSTRKVRIQRREMNSGSMISIKFSGVDVRVSIKIETSGAPRSWAVICLGGLLLFRPSGVMSVDPKRANRNWQVICPR